MAIQHVSIDKIVDNPFQPRSHFDSGALQSLADEMQAEGFWSGPLQGRRTKNGKIELVFGHRRLRALKLLKRDTVAIEIVDLTDAQMALRSLEENLQREGLTDLEKADSVKRAVEIAREELRAAGKSEKHAIPQIAKRLGLPDSWIYQLCEISSSMDEKNRAPIGAGFITAKTALVAKKWGGNEYVKTLAKQGKEAKTGTVPKPTHMTVNALRKVVDEAPEHVQKPLKDAIVAGEITTPKEAEQKARRLAAGRAARYDKNPPPDLHAVILRWTDRLEDWDQQMTEVIPYVEHLDDVPEISKPFRAALKHFVETAARLLDETPAEPRSVGRGQSRGARGPTN